MMTRANQNWPTDLVTEISAPAPAPNDQSSSPRVSAPVRSRSPRRMTRAARENSLYRYARLVYESDRF